MSSQPNQCDVCGSTGIIRSDIRAENGALRGSTASLCDCRKNLEPRHGKAHWWVTRPVATRRAGDAIWDGTISISCEVPVSKDNYPLIRTKDTAYWPHSAVVEIESSSVAGSHSLRDMAEWLNKVADEMDAMDDADTAKSTPDAEDGER